MSASTESPAAKSSRDPATSRSASRSRRPSDVAPGRPGADQPVCRRDRRPPVHPRRPGARQADALRHHHRARLPDAVAAALPAVEDGSPQAPEAYQGLAMGINYGLNKVRFPAPVKVDSKVRAASRAGCPPRPGEPQAPMQLTREDHDRDRRRGERPGCVAEFADAPGLRMTRDERGRPAATTRAAPRAGPRWPCWRSAGVEAPRGRVPEGRRSSVRGARGAASASSGARPREWVRTKRETPTGRRASTPDSERRRRDRRHAMAAHPDPDGAPHRREGLSSGHRSTPRERVLEIL